jgi:hypothetical protein
MEVMTDVLVGWAQMSPVSFVLCLEGGGAGEIGDGQINEDRWLS